jgi:hypothetical protein
MGASRGRQVQCELWIVYLVQLATVEACSESTPCQLLLTKY